MTSLLRIFRSRRLLVVVLLGFSSGMPLGLVGTTLQAWMKSEQVDLSVIGLFSFVGLPYALKVLWAPLMDRFSVPVLGRRRGWLLTSQIFLIASVIAMAFSHPKAAPMLTAILALLVCFFSASQDIVVDAYRTDVLEKDELGPGAALYITGYRVAMLVSGAMSLVLADRMSWVAVYLTMASVMSIGVVATLLAPEPRGEIRPPRSLRDAVVLPLKEFFQRKAAIEILFFILFYMVDVVMAVALTTVFMLDMGFSKTDIGAVTKTVGFAVTMAGTLSGGIIIARMGLKRALWTFGFMQGVSISTFMLLAHVGHSYPIMVAAIGIENFCSAMANTAFMAFLMSLCDKRFSATQYALFASCMALTRVVAGAPTGFLAKAFGWENYFLFCIFLMIPGLLFLTRFDRWARPEFVKDPA